MSTHARTASFHEIFSSISLNHSKICVDPSQFFWTQTQPGFHRFPFIWLVNFFGAYFIVLPLGRMRSHSSTSSWQARLHPIEQLFQHSLQLMTIQKESEWKSQTFTSEPISLNTFKIIYWTTDRWVRADVWVGWPDVPLTPGPSRFIADCPASRLLRHLSRWIHTVFVRHSPSPTGKIIIPLDDAQLSSMVQVLV